MCTFEEHGGDARFLEKLEQIAELHSAKQHDYGAGDDPFANVRASQEFGVEPWIGTLIRLNDKITRLKSFIAKGELKNESVIDSLLDISVYALIALILYEETLPTVSVGGYTYPVDRSQPPGVARQAAELDEFDKALKRDD